MVAATMITKKTYVWYIVLSISKFILGIEFSCDTERPLQGSDVTCKCVTPNNIEWQLNDVTLSVCTATGVCSPQIAGYVFQTDITNPDKEYSLTVEGFAYSSCNVYSCTDFSTSEEKKLTLKIAAFDHTSPSVFVEPGVNQNGNIEITTECLLKESDIMVEWFYVKENSLTEVPYTPDASFQTATNCVDTCNGEAAVRLNIGFTYTEEGVQTVKFGLKVHHKEDTTNVLKIQTSSDYKIKAKTPGKYVCFWCKKLDKRWKCCFFFFLLILAIVLLIGIIIGIGVEAKYPLWGRLNQRRRILSFFPFFFGFGLFLCDLIRQRCGANEPGGNDPTNKSSDDIPLNKNQSPVMNTKYGKTRTLSTVEGGKVTLSCPFPESVTYPEWRGPTKLMLYTKMDDQSGEINSNAPAFERLQYASNKRDLILSNAVTSDSGDYTCSYTGQGNHTIVLKVNPGKGDKASNVVNTGSHPDEKKKQGRPQPPPPGANHREGSGSVVSGRDVEMQETDTSLNRRQLPDIHDRKGRGLSANYTDDAHPLVSINIPTKKPGALESIPDSAREEVTKKRKKKKKKRVETEDDQSD